MTVTNGISAEALARRYPVLFHMAEAGSWPTIAEYGLLSTTALVDLFQIHGAQRLAIESRHRPENCDLQPDAWNRCDSGSKPMNDRGLLPRPARRPDTQWGLVCGIAGTAWCSSGLVAPPQGHF